ncbi:MAG: nitrophenyl compound nitroreductase subunit ArsF family protein [Candidatus Omnitrophota bacterium]
MKRALLILLVIMLVTVGAGYSFAVDKAPGKKVIVYYFHGNFRCPACHKLEQYSKEAIEANFPDALTSGKLEFKAINVEERGNEHFTKDYRLYTKSLVISLVQDGKEVEEKNLGKIWEYSGDKQKFFEYVKSEINDFLKGL